VFHCVQDDVNERDAEQDGAHNGPDPVAHADRYRTRLAYPRSGRLRMEEPPDPIAPLIVELVLLGLAECPRPQAVLKLTVEKQFQMAMNLVSLLFSELLEFL
jgi:hypothetical protein